MSSSTYYPQTMGSILVERVILKSLFYPDIPGNIVFSTIWNFRSTHLLKEKAK